jgi:hypothetical protein
MLPGRGPLANWNMVLVLMVVVVVPVVVELR